ncbi:hypothetical protein KY330_05265 [Candidatus Woesearchaeota archaeon]|nr:hypothetical protein [Candidatus Woesearchaeota archaeon]
MKKDLVPCNSDLSEAVGRVHAIMESRAKDTANRIYDKLKDLYFAIVDNNLIRRIESFMSHVSFVQDFPYKETWICTDDPNWHAVQIHRWIEHGTFKPFLSYDLSQDKDLPEDEWTDKHIANFSNQFYDSITILTGVDWVRKSGSPSDLYKILISNPKFINILGKHFPRFREYSIFQPKIRITESSVEFSYSLYDFFTETYSYYRKEIRQDLEHIDEFIINGLQQKYAEKLQYLL